MSAMRGLYVVVFQECFADYTVDSIIDCSLVVIIVPPSPKLELNLIGLSLKYLCVETRPSHASTVLWNTISSVLSL